MSAPHWPGGDASWHCINRSHTDALGGAPQSALRNPDEESVNSVFDAEKQEHFAPCPGTLAINSRCHDSTERSETNCPGATIAPRGVLATNVATERPRPWPWLGVSVTVCYSLGCLLIGLLLGFQTGQRHRTTPTSQAGMSGFVQQDPAQHHPFLLPVPSWHERLRILWDEERQTAERWRRRSRNPIDSRHRPLGVPPMRRRTNPDCRDEGDDEEDPWPPVPREPIRWGDPIPSTKCTRYGSKEYSAQLLNLLPESDPLTECQETPLFFGGWQMLPERCDISEPEEPTGIVNVTGFWIIDFVEGDCVTWWNYTRDKGCSPPGSGIHRYEAQLINLNPDDDWEQMCLTTPGNINNEYFDPPSVCNNRGDHGIWGIWILKDWRCRGQR